MEDGETHPNNSRVIVHAMPGLGFIDSKILHFSSTEDDVGIGILHGWNELLGRPIQYISRQSNFLSWDREK